MSSNKVFGVNFYFINLSFTHDDEYVI